MRAQPSGEPAKNDTSQLPHAIGRSRLARRLEADVRQLSAWVMAAAAAQQGRGASPLSGAGATGASAAAGEGDGRLEGTPRKMASPAARGKENAGALVR